MWPVSQVSCQVGPWPIWFYCKFRNFILWVLKWSILWLHSTSWSKVMVIWIVQNVYISMDLTIICWHVTQNHFCQIYKRFVIQGHKCDSKAHWNVTFWKIQTTITLLYDVLWSKTIHHLKLRAWEVCGTGAQITILLFNQSKTVLEGQ